MHMYVILYMLYVIYIYIYNIFILHICIYTFIFMNLCIYLFIYLFIYLLIHLLFVYLFICSSILCADANSSVVIVHLDCIIYRHILLHLMLQSGDRSCFLFQREISSCNCHSLNLMTSIVLKECILPLKLYFSRSGLLD